jgi:hypothetical protein
MCWCFNDIRRLIRAYPRHKHVGDIFGNIGEDMALEEGEQPYKDEEQGSDSGAPSEASKWSDAEDYEAEDWNAAVEALPDDHAVAGTSGEEMECALAPVSAESAELVGVSTKRMETDAVLAVELQRIGAISLAVTLVKEQRKEARRLRKISAMNIGVLVALNNDRGAYAAEERKRLRLLREMHDTRQSLSTTKAHLTDAAEILRNQKERPLRHGASVGGQARREGVLLVRSRRGTPERRR